jgi:putative Na+/H+ antiporter
MIPLFVAITAFHGWSTMVEYVGNVNVADAIFVVVIMAMASSLPIIRFTETVIAKVSAVGKGPPASWWLAILTLGPLLGSFITGPAAMTICALLLRHRFYSLKPSERLKYATLGLLFVNISVGGVLTQFGSPPLVIAASAWNWDLAYMLTHFGWKAVIGIILSNSLYLTVFRREFARLATNVPDEEQDQERRRPIPWRITAIHILFLCWTVANAHYPVLVILGILFFLAFVSATRLNQQAIALRPALLVGFFLAALIIHGGCQQWWIGPVLGGLSRWPLMLAATILTAFNDNAAITYLASLVSGFSATLKYVVMAGAVTGGGLTVISKLSKSSWSVDPRVALWRVRNFAAVPLPRSPGTNAYRRSSLYVASISVSPEKANRVQIESASSGDFVPVFAEVEIQYNMASFGALIGTTL